MARRARTPPPGRWKAGLCACADDPALCCSACFCSCNATGQMYERTTKSGTCLRISLLCWTLFVLTQVLAQTSNSLANVAVAATQCSWWGCFRAVDRDLVTAAYVVGGVSGGVGFVGSVATTYFVCTARRLVRERDRIPDDGCGDCCASYWCACCTLVQMLRQDGVRGTDYRACSATAV